MALSLAGAQIPWKRTLSAVLAQVQKLESTQWSAALTSFSVLLSSWWAWKSSDFEWWLSELHASLRQCQEKLTYIEARRS